MTGLEAAIGGLAAAAGARRVAVAAGPVGAPRTVLVGADEPFHAASTMKVAVLVELYRRASAGDISLDAPVPVRTDFRSLADGSPYVLDRADDSEFALYGRVGEDVPLRDLARLMIVRSSNVATNLLIDLLGAPEIDGTVRGLGVGGVSVLRGVEDGPAFAAGLNNTVTAAGLASLLERIADGSAAPRAACEAMLEVLAAQEFNEGIPAALPRAARVAHKTGSIASLYHDAAVVYPPGGRPYVLVVLTEGLDETSAAPALVAGVARAVHRELGAPGSS